MSCCGGCGGQDEKPKDKAEEDKGKSSTEKSDQ